jgi:hypothetical protein
VQEKVKAKKVRNYDTPIAQEEQQQEATVVDSKPIEK